MFHICYVKSYARHTKLFFENHSNEEKANLETINDERRKVIFKKLIEPRIFLKMNIVFKKNLKIYKSFSSIISIRKTH